MQDGERQRIVDIVSHIGVKDNVQLWGGALRLALETLREAGE